MRESLYNLGWLIKINLEDTQYKNIKIKIFERGNIDNKDDWIHCKIENKIFEGACGPLNLIELIQCFKNIIEEQKLG
ncbi:Imm53 family immunity protein [Formosa sp. Hel1_33_131]|uniref:Imm53 family immunity protein n=1 Tax=Formosa sp. Hel1_33_131 TaxID=1336794 RepID=UPI003FA42ED9